MLTEMKPLLNKIHFTHNTHKNAVELFDYLQRNNQYEEFKSGFKYFALFDANNESSSHTRVMESHRVLCLDQYFSLCTCLYYVIFENSMSYISIATHMILSYTYP